MIVGLQVEGGVMSQVPVSALGEFQEPRRAQLLMACPQCSQLYFRITLLQPTLDGLRCELVSALKRPQRMHSCNRIIALDQSLQLLVDLLALSGDEQTLSRLSLPAVFVPQQCDQGFVVIRDGLISRATVDGADTPDAPHADRFVQPP